MKKKDLIAAVIFLSAAIILYAYASTYPVKEGVSTVLNPGFYPKLLAAIAAVLATIWIFTTLKKQNDDEDCPVQEKKPFFRTRGGKLFLITVVLLVIYPFTLNYLGFATSSFLFIFVLILSLTRDFKSHLLVTLIISIIITALMFLVFRVVLQIPFPSGLLI